MLKLQLGIAQKLTLVFILFATLVLAGLGFLAYSSGRSSLRSATIAELLATAIEKQAGLNAWVDEKQADITRLAINPTVIEKTASLIVAGPGSTERQIAHEQLSAEIVPHLYTGEFTDLFLMNPNTGEVFFATNPGMEGKYKANQPYFINGKEDSYIQDLYYSTELQGPAMTASAPIRAKDGQLLAVLAGRLNLDEMNTIISRRSGLRQSDDAFLLNTSNLFVTQPRLHGDPAILQRGVHTQAAANCLTGNSGLLEAPDYRGVPSINVYRWLPEHRMCLIVKLEESEAYAPARAFGLTVAGFSILVLLTAAALAYVLAHSLTRPILSLQHGVIRFRNDDLGFRLPETRQDELGVLAREFNKMAGSLAEKEFELREHARTLEQKVQERTHDLQETVSQLYGAEQIGQIGSWAWHISENRVVWTDGLYRVFGLEPQKFGATYEAYLEQVHPQDREHARHTIQDAYQAGGAFEFESRILRKDGQSRYLYTRGEMMFDEQESPARMIGIAIDITERRQAEQALRLENERFQRFVDSNIVGIVIARANGSVVLANDYYLNILGVPRKAFLAGSVDWRKFTPPEWLRADENAIRELRERGICEPYEKEYIRADGTRVPVYLANAILPGPEEQIAAFILDITERKRAEEALQRTAEDLRRSNAELEQFAYVASHDLQEPLRMISSYVQLLAERYQGKLDQDADEFISYAVDGATRMQNLINDLLAYSRVGTRGNDLRPVSTKGLLDEALENLRLTIEESHANIEYDPLPVVKGDPVQLSMVFQNLLSNAIKFRSAEPPCIRIGVQQEDSEWVFSVRDNGIGFDPKFAERVFIIFQRLHTREAYPGTGIGLAICKRVIQRHGGRIWAESERGKGSLFSFPLPVLEEHNNTVSIEENQ